MSRPPSYGSSTLTPRQIDVLRLAAEGKVDRVIAAELNIGRGTVGSYTRAACDTLGVDTKKEAVAVAKERGLI